MKHLLTLLTLMLCCTFARADVATDLAALKAAFPEYAGPSKSRHNPADPYVRDCVDKYTKAARGITPATIAQNVSYITTQLERDLAKYDEQVSSVDKDSKSSGQLWSNAKANAYWLRTKVKPWVAKLAAVK